MGKRWQDYITLLAGFWLMATPWMMGTTGDFLSSWNAWIIGAFIILVELSELTSAQPFLEEWLTTLLGAWTFVAPWVLHFGNPTSAWNAWVVGAVVFLLSVLTIGQTGSTGASARR